MSTATAPEATEMSTEDKLRLYLAAHWGILNPTYEVCSPGKCWKASNGKFTLKSRVRYTNTKDGLVYTKGFFRKANTQDEAIEEVEALKGMFFSRIRESGVHLCTRCGGAGGAKQWPGFTCFRCGGNGIDPGFDWEKAITRALDGEDFAGDYLAKVEAKKAAQAAEDERQRQEAAAARQRAADANRAAVEECLPDLLPRSFKARAFFATGNAHKDLGNDHLTNLICFERAAERPDWENYLNTPLNLSWIQNFVLPAILKAEEAVKRAAADTSDYVGTEGQPITVEATVVFVKDFPSVAYGTKWLTILRDEHSNRLTYWNLVNIVDPIEAQAFGNDGKRPAKKGDKIKFTATVKKHEVYKGTKGTVLQRARKAILIKAAEETK